MAGAGGAAAGRDALGDQGARTARRAGRALPVHRRSRPRPATIRSKLSGHSGVNAEMVAHLELDDVAHLVRAGLLGSSGWRRSAIWPARSMCTGRSSRPAAPTRGDMLDLVRTLKAVGVRVSVLPRLLEAVGSSVEFDDLHGVTVMGVRRFELTRSSAAVKRAFDLIGASLGLLAISPLMLAIAIAIKLDSRGPVFFRQPRVGRHGRHFDMLKFRTMVAERRRDEGLAARPQRGPGRALQDRRGPTHHPRGQAPAQERAGRAAPAASTSCAAR